MTCYCQVAFLTINKYSRHSSLRHQNIVNHDQLQSTFPAGEPEQRQRPTPSCLASTEHDRHHDLWQCGERSLLLCRCQIQVPPNCTIVGVGLISGMVFVIFSDTQLLINNRCGHNPRDGASKIVVCFIIFWIPLFAVIAIN